jgi:hypothetical protein
VTGLVNQLVRDLRLPGRICGNGNGCPDDGAELVVAPFPLALTSLLIPCPGLGGAFGVEHLDQLATDLEATTEKGESGTSS